MVPIWDAARTRTWIADQQSHDPLCRLGAHRLAVFAVRVDDGSEPNRDGGTREWQQSVVGSRLHPDRYRMGNSSVGILGAISICATGAYDLALFMPSMMAATFLSI